MPTSKMTDLAPKNGDRVIRHFVQQNGHAMWYNSEKSGPVYTVLSKVQFSLNVFTRPPSHICPVLTRLCIYSPTTCNSTMHFGCTCTAVILLHTMVCCMLDNNFNQLQANPLKYGSSNVFQEKQSTPLELMSSQENSPFPATNVLTEEQSVS